MKKDNKVFLKHIFESINFIEKYTKSFTKTQFLKNIQLQDAVTRRLEIIGEAVKYLPDELKKKHPLIPWKKIAGTRDILIHEYFGADFDLIWKVVKQELPKLKKQTKEILDKI
ncbi:MAG: hypothetical protein US89_C0003G0010 [Candidatus Peregrinibacteria bacterium GW2011_GWF2_38_29]|nr:MAG: hypothetical protein US89_C0003G0010 [Candidatus Peregrinibacteria bacterium GW2011_GWF2_38_29]HBB02892.1 hypothetical protein [Candidatus Peregrinibacteria bacterium]